MINTDIRTSISISVELILHNCKQYCINITLTSIALFDAKIRTVSYINCSFLGTDNFWEQKSEHYFLKPNVDYSVYCPSTAFSATRGIF